MKHLSRDEIKETKEKPIIVRQHNFSIETVRNIRKNIDKYDFTLSVKIPHFPSEDYKFDWPILDILAIFISNDQHCDGFGVILEFIIDFSSLYIMLRVGCQRLWSAIPS